MCCKDTHLSHTSNTNWVQIVLWELLAADVEGVEGIGAVGTVLEEVFFVFGLLLHGLVFAAIALALCLQRNVASTLHSGRLEGKDEIVIVLAVEVRNEALLAGETLAALVNEVHCRAINGDTLGTHGSDDGGTGVHADKVHKDVAVATESGRDGESGVELSAKGVDENGDLLVGVLVQDKVNIVGIKVPTADVAFEVEIVFSLCHYADCLV